MSRKPTRREFLQYTAGTALLAPLAACSSSECASEDGASIVAFDAEAIVENESEFSLGIQAGAMTASSALLWGFCEDGGNKRLRVWRDTDVPGQVAMVFDEEVAPTDGYFKVPVSGLGAHTWYRYAFFESGDSGRSAVGTFRSAPADDCLETVRVAATACTNFDHAPYTALSMMAAQQPDLFLQLGDMSYNDGAETQQEFRDKWRQTLNDPGYRDILRSAGMYATWDDHELTDNSRYYTSLSDSARAVGIEAYFETLPIERFEGNRFWTSYRWGATAEFFVLDSRSERRPETIGDTDIYLSPEQMAWFKDALAASTAHFKVVLNSVPMVGLPSLWIMQEDRWAGYQQQRDEILNFIDDQSIDGVYFLAGDFHVSMVGRIEPSGPRSQMYEILVGPGGNRGNPLWIATSGLPEEQATVAPPEQFDFFYGEPVTTLLEFDPILDVVRVQYADASTGDVLFEEAIAPRRLRRPMAAG